MKIVIYPQMFYRFVFCKKKKKVPFIFPYIWGNKLIFEETAAEFARSFEYF